MARIRLGVVLETTGMAIRPALTAIARLGVQGIQFSSVGELAPDQLGTTARREFRTILKSFELTPAAVYCPIRRGLDVAQDQQPRLEYLQKVMQLTFDIGAKTVVIPFPRIPTDLESPVAKTLKESLEALARVSDRMGTIIALECGLDPINAVKEYLARFDTGVLQITYDPANFLLNGHDPIANLIAASGVIAYSQARDARTATVTGGAREVPVGAGDIDWMTYFATLASIDYQGYITVDREEGTRRFADVSAEVEFLKRFMTPG